MTIDEGLLFDHRSFRDPTTGVEEEFFQPTLGSGRSIAVLARPNGHPQDLGFVLCHSFGMEQMHLSRLETRLARALTAGGFPTIRFHGQGYGDSEGDMRAISLTSHLQEARDASDILAAQTGVTMIGAIGVRLGGAVAALIADERELPVLGMIEPMVDGSQYMREFIRSQVFSNLTGEVDEGFFPGRPADGRNGQDPAPSDDDVPVRDLRKELAEKGWTDVKGFPLTLRAHEEISAVDLTTDLRRFAGSSLLLSITRSGKPVASIGRLAARLEDLGGRCSVRSILERQAASFGQYHYAVVGEDRTTGKVDTHFELGTSILRIVDEWTTVEVRGEVKADAGERGSGGS